MQKLTVRTEKRGFETQHKLYNIFKGQDYVVALIRIFNKHVGTSPYEYLINFRINKSKTLLKETSLTVNEISVMVGYNEVTNFIRDFKKYLGTTPLKYRNYWIS
jgi:AraC-like DNA-binding protein